MQDHSSIASQALKYRQETGLFERVQKKIRTLPQEERPEGPRFVSLKESYNGFDHTLQRIWDAAVAFDHNLDGVLNVLESIRQNLERSKRSRSPETDALCRRILLDCLKMPLDHFRSKRNEKMETQWQKRLEEEPNIPSAIYKPALSSAQDGAFLAYLIWIKRVEKTLPHAKLLADAMSDRKAAGLKPVSHPSRPLMYEEIKPFSGITPRDFFKEEFPSVLSLVPQQDLCEFLEYMAETGSPLLSSALYGIKPFYETIFKSPVRDTLFENSRPYGTIQISPFSITSSPNADRQLPGKIYAFLKKLSQSDNACASFAAKLCDHVEEIRQGQIEIREKQRRAFEETEAALREIWLAPEIDSP